MFKAECDRWIEFWHLRDWFVSYCHAELEDGTIADCERSISNRIASIRLNVHTDVILDDEIIRRTAFHEVCELLIGGLVCLATARFVIEDELTGEAHAIIRRLEHCVFKGIA